LSQQRLGYGRGMQFKISYTTGHELKKVVLEAPSLVAVMREGYRQTKWDSVLEVTTADDKPVQLVQGQTH
jgi:hypothetical protein